MNSRERELLDRHITGNYGEDQMAGAAQEEALYNALWDARSAMGKAGANSDLNHPLRKAWEAASAAIAQYDQESAE